MVQTVKNLSAMNETWARSLDWEDPLEKEIATHSSIPAWRIPMNLAVYSPWSCKELDKTEWLTLTNAHSLCRAGNLQGRNVLNEGSTTIPKGFEYSSKHMKSPGGLQLCKVSKGNNIGFNLFMRLQEDQQYIQDHAARKNLPVSRFIFPSWRYICISRTHSYQTHIISPHVYIQPPLNDSS